MSTPKPDHRADLLALPSDCRLVRVGPNKRPQAGDGWFDRDNFTPDEAATLNGTAPPAWGVKTGPISGQLVLDLDAPGWCESFEEVTGHPISDLPRTIAWTSSKPGRSGHLFTVHEEWWPYLANRRSFTRPWREGDPLGEGGKKSPVTVWELRWDRHQSVVMGVHPETGSYRWLPGRSPHDISDPAVAPDWLLQALLVQEHPDAPVVVPTAEDAGRAVAMLERVDPVANSTYSEWLRVGMALHHTDPGLLAAWVEWSRPMATFDEAECLAKWEGFGKGHKGKQATIATLHYLAKAGGYREPKRQQSTPGETFRDEAAAAAPAAEGEGNPPFTVVGWDTKREQVWYQHRQTGQLAQIRAQQKSNLLQLAPVRHWESLFPNKSGNGVDWTAACSYVIDLANRAGVFYPAAVRGRGVWLDSGRVVWHLGNRLEVDGLEIPLADHRSGHTYAARQPLPIDRAAAALTDAEGQRILLAVAAMGWTGPIDHLAVLGWAVCTVAAGAIPKRTGVQVTSRSASGKTTVTDLVWRPLLGGAGEYRSASTEAGIRQLLGPDALAVVVDETEAGEGRRREGMLRLMRHSYDGTTIDRGTTHGEALAFPVRFGMALIAINATTPEAADANRMVTVTRQHLPASAWEAARGELQAAMPSGTDDRFNRRVVDHLHTLLANVSTFQVVVGRQIGGGVAGRLGDTWAPLLAGAYLLTSAAVLTEAQAVAWLAENGWDAAELDAPDGDEEGVRLLERILAYQVPWHSGDGKADIPRRSVRQLVEVARQEMAHRDAEGAALALGQLGIKATTSRLVIANSHAQLAPILNGTRWADGGHVPRLRDLPGAEYDSKRKVRISKGSPPERATYLPWERIE
jgi:hypothetical protein